LQPSRAATRLRAATETLHRRVEASLDIMPRLADPALRPALIRRYAAFHIPADASLAPHLEGVPGLDFRGRSRAPLLGRFVGGRPLPAFPVPASRAEALGMLYVLEGSTLGGRELAKRLDHLFGPGTIAGRRFFSGRAADTGRAWRAFLDRLERAEIDAATSAEVIAAAQETFAAFEQWVEDWEGADAQRQGLARRADDDRERL